MTRPHTLTLVSVSRASDAGYLAMGDLAVIAADIGAEYRIVGGNMVGLLVAHHRAGGLAPDRETADADFGAAPAVIADPRLPQALHDLGYQSREAANRFVRDHHGLSLAVDLLAPSYDSRLASNQRYGDLVVDAVPGLSYALARPGTAIALRATLTDGSHLAYTLILPDLHAALCLKAYPYRGRFARRDALDIWRLLEAVNAAGAVAATWPQSPTSRDASRILHQFFARPDGSGPADASDDRRSQTRIRALVARVVGAPD